MRTFKAQKLWRDKMIQKYEADHGSKIHWHSLNDEEFDHKIRLKIVEESQEVASASSLKELMEEVADLYEAIDSLLALHSIAKENVYTFQAQKRKEKGGFSGRHYVHAASHPPGSVGERYCLRDPKKYPEITDASLIQTTEDHKGPKNE